MRSFQSVILLLLNSLVVASVAVAQQPAPANPLEPLAWLVGGTWVSETKRPDGQVVTIESRYEWGSQNKSVKFTTTYKNSIGPALAAEGTYYWHPGKEQLLMLQTGSSVTESVVQKHETGLLHDNVLTRVNGSTDRQRADFVREGDDTFLLKASVLNKDEWKDAVTFTYKRRRAEGAANATPATTTPKVDQPTKPAATPPKVSAAAAALTIQDLAWLSGSWREQKPGVETEEHWIAPNSELMLGVNRTARESRRGSFEFLRIAKTANGISYFASPGGRPATEFTLIDAEANKVVFENPQHDFPQRIIYWKSEDGALHARIEGTIGGQPRSQEWRWVAISKKD